MRDTYSQEERRADIISAAVRIANKKGFGKINHKDVAEECLLDMNKRLLSHYFSMANLRKVVATDERLTLSAKDEAKRLGLVK